MNIQDQPKICVAIRKRPLNKKEIQRNQADIILVKNEQTVIVSEYKQKVDLTKFIEQSAFNFDHAFDESSNNQQIYAKAVRPLVQSAFLGAKVTCFAYGQTGSGKTYTMNGDLQNGVPGLYILGAQDIFQLQSNKQYSHLKIQVSFFQIYCSRLFDLLNNRNQLKLRQDNKGNVHIVGLEERPLNSAQQFMQTIEYGSSFRVTSQNSTNADSSRSHAILQITLKEGKKIYGKMSFIDLAGCQRGADHMDQNKQTRIDGAQINKSLLSLKQCIRALDQGKGHTPFRGSKLTMVLKDSFVGFCRTVMIGNISPNISSCQNTLNTLRYADRVKELKKPNSNEPLSREDQLAKELMLPRQTVNAVKIVLDKDDDAQDILLKKQKAQKMLGIKNLNTNDSQNNLKNNNYNQNPKSVPFNQYQNQNPNIMLAKKVTDQNKIRKYSVEQQGPAKKSFVENSQKLMVDEKTVLMRQNNHQQNVSTNHNQAQRSLQFNTEMSLGKLNKNTIQFNQNMNINRAQPIQKQSLQKNNLNQYTTRPSGFSFGGSNSNNNQRVFSIRQQPMSNRLQSRPANQWNLVVKQFKQWNPQADRSNLRYYQQAHQTLTGKMVSQQQELIQLHSNCINKEIEIIKSETRFINQVQTNKEYCEVNDYIANIESSIEQKIERLMNLKNRVRIFKDHLNQHQMIEQKLFTANNDEDQQLLDDLPTQDFQYRYDSLNQQRLF